jgi:hypothetical protein
VLSGRRPPNADGQVAIRELERLGATVRTFEADTADREALQGILKEIGRTLPPLRGIVHAVGVVRDAVLLNQCWNEARDVFRGKVEGAWLLHELTRNVPLEFFILYSAAAVLLGGPGQGVYPAANADLDALARARRRVGLPALSVAWGSWGGAGMAAELASRDIDVWSARGLGEITPADGFAQLEKLLAEGVAYGAVIPIRWSQFLSQPSAQADRDFFSAVAAPDRTETGAGRPAETASVIGRLKALAASQRRNELLAFLTGCTRNVLGLDGSTPLDAEAALKEAGLDSLMAVELRNTLMRASDQPLPATLLFDYPTLNALTEYLGRIWNLELGSALVRPTTPAASMRAPADTLVNLSDEEAEALLLEELASTSPGKENDESFERRAVALSGQACAADDP